LAHASPGGIILLHDGIGQTIAALPTIISSLRRQGYVFVSLDELTSKKVPEKNNSIEKTERLKTDRNSDRKAIPLEKGSAPLSSQERKAKIQKEKAKKLRSDENA
jgi:hypothetical protein